MKRARGVCFTALYDVCPIRSQLSYSIQEHLARSNCDRLKVTEAGPIDRPLRLSYPYSWWNFLEEQFHFVKVEPFSKVVLKQYLNMLKGGHPVDMKMAPLWSHFGSTFFFQCTHRGRQYLASPAGPLNCTFLRKAFWPCPMIPLFLISTAKFCVQVAPKCWR